MKIVPLPYIAAALFIPIMLSAQTSSETSGLISTESAQASTQAANKDNETEQAIHEKEIHDRIDKIDKDIDKLNLGLAKARIYFENSQEATQPLSTDNPEERDALLKETAKRWEYVQHFKQEITKLEVEKQELLIQLEEGK